MIHCSCPNAFANGQNEIGLRIVFFLWSVPVYITTTATLQLEDTLAVVDMGFRSVLPAPVRGLPHRMLLG